jgi:hypothetical protein
MYEDDDITRAYRIVSVLILLMLVLAAAGCTGLDAREQRVVSGTAIGGTLACWPGAALGAGIGYLIGYEEQKDE